MLQVAAGLGHCLALTSDGLLYTWGWNAAGCLGLGEPGKQPHDIGSPTQVWLTSDTMQSVFSYGLITSLCMHRTIGNAT